MGYSSCSCCKLRGDCCEEHNRCKGYERIGLDMGLGAFVDYVYCYNRNYACSYEAYLCSCFRIDLPIVAVRIEAYFVGAVEGGLLVDLIASIARQSLILMGPFAGSQRWY